MDILQDIYAGAVIAAGGMAQRMQGINKQSLMIQGVPVLVRSIQRMAEVKQIRQIVVVARPELFSQLKQWKIEYSLPDFEVVAGGENWNELRVMVEKSNIKEKDRVLDILDHTPEGVDPEIALKKLPGGTYRYMLTNFYPKLRSASSVQLLRIVPVVAPPVVKEEIKVVEVDTVKRTPQKPVVQEPEPCRCDPPLMAIKTNLASWAALITPNIELEAYLGSRYSIAVEGAYRWLKDSKAKGNSYNVASVSPEIRMYVRDDRSFQSSYWGLYGLYGEYDVKFGSTGRQGNIRGLGISYGYIFKFNRFDCLYFDLGISAGYNRLRYDKYFWYDPCNAFKEHKGKNYWGPSKIKASLVWRF